ncbi:branched-chain amino acid ABC transporter permease [Nocardioides sp. TF02-7]|uniref:branched-chain amino acid ABC transporter permease n=1 Tax=Nocardioides sp. TF02-7 TaxID=2917724 RepID=UPI001F0674ED|nr:branched-chain amino acid ABC transporter permease [Nocardioides sp. TF02-7]UMG92137.1 branched-chain amino acid ABC transporter permease [Nocardioides sp. TF02-7]
MRFEGRRTAGKAPVARWLLVAAALLGTVVLVGGPAAAETEACRASAEQGCLTGTLDTGEERLADVEVLVTPVDQQGQPLPGVEPTTVTTDDNGVWSFAFSEQGRFQVEIVEDSLPDGVDALPSENKLLKGPGNSVFVNGQLGGLASGQPVILGIRAEGFEAEGSDLDYFLQSSVNGIRLGLLLALASIGLSLIYGTTGLSNFAHAELLTLGGFLGYLLVNTFGLPLWPAVALVAVLAGAFGWFQDRALWQPLRRRGLGLIQLMIVTIGLSLALQYVFQLVDTETIRITTGIPESLQIGSIGITWQSVIAMIIAVVLLIAVGFALVRTRIGQATRAVADNPALAAASGIDVDRVIRLVWTVAAALAGLAGVLYALVTNGVKWDSGMQILLLLFAAVTLGGLGTAFGALIGAMIIGYVVEVSPVFGMPNDYKYATALVLLILLLLVRPQGLLGRAERVG